MSHIDTVRVNTAQSTAVADKNDVQKNYYLMAMKNHSIMGDAMVTMEEMMLMFTELAAKKFEQMREKTNVGRDASDMATRVESALANIATADGTATLDQDILDYIKDNNILVNNKPIGDFINGASKPKEAGKFGTMDQTKPVNGAAGDNADNVAGTLPTVPNEGTGAINLDKKALKSIQSTLESASTRATDFVQQDQLKLQQLMQSFNTAVAMANAVQSMNAESTKAIAQSIR
ncbi:hypothetical protein [Rouxiella badensis]|uniref:hypothetical protein n=1 Tax=Rouxiella badensis TaxID=1646377 RepID=UPI001787E275|nr:hypothetical protein [Rouxiella badensis]QOI55300.1 hypothetical protein H2866_20705 [Rouxiella badensis subsp. acadiensis]